MPIIPRIYQGVVLPHIMPRLPDGVKMEPYGVEFLGDPGEGQIIFPPDVPEPRPKTRAQLCERVRTGYNPFADATSSRYYVRPSVVEFLEDKLELGVNLTDFINVTPGNVVVFKNIIDSTIKADKKQKEAKEKAEQARAARDKREQELEEYRVRQECRAAAARAKAVAEAEAAARAEVAAEEAARARSSPTGSVCSVDRNASPDSRLSSGGFGHQPPPAPYGHPPAGYGPYGYGPPPPGYAAYPPPPPHGHPPAGYSPYGYPPYPYPPYGGYPPYSPYGPSHSPHSAQTAGQATPGTPQPAPHRASPQEVTVQQVPVRETAAARSQLRTHRPAPQAQPQADETPASKRRKTRSQRPHIEDESLRLPAVTVQASPAARNNQNQLQRTYPPVPPFNGNPPKPSSSSRRTPPTKTCKSTTCTHKCSKLEDPFKDPLKDTDSRFKIITSLLSLSLSNEQDSEIDAKSVMAMILGDCAATCKKIKIDQKERQRDKRINATAQARSEQEEMDDEPIVVEPQPVEEEEVMDTEEDIEIFEPVPVKTEPHR